MLNNKAVMRLKDTLKGYPGIHLEKCYLAPGCYELLVRFTDGRLVKVDTIPTARELQALLQPKTPA